MRCVICNGDDIKTVEVKEECAIGNDIVCIPIKVPVCQTCGERYYDRHTMQSLEKIEEKISKTAVKLKVIGKVLMYEEASHFV